MSDKLKGIEQLHPANHALYRRVTTLLNMRWQYDRICDEVGLVGPRREKDLVEWFLDYKSPKGMPKMQSNVLTVPTRSPALMEKGVRMQAWRKQHEGAEAALRELEMQKMVGEP